MMSCNVPRPFFNKKVFVKLGYRNPDLLILGYTEVTSPLLREKPKIRCREIVTLREYIATKNY